MIVWTSRACVLALDARVTLVVRSRLRVWDWESTPCVLRLAGGRVRRIRNPSLVNEREDLKMSRIS